MKEVLLKQAQLIINSSFPCYTLFALYNRSEIHDNSSVVSDADVNYN